MNAKPLSHCQHPFSFLTTCFQNGNRRDKVLDELPIFLVRISSGPQRFGTRGDSSGVGLKLNFNIWNHQRVRYCCPRHSNVCKRFFFSYVAKTITEELRVKLVAEDRVDYFYLKILILRNVFRFDFLTLPHNDLLHPAPEFLFLKKELHRPPPPDIKSFIHHTPWKWMCMNYNEYWNFKTDRDKVISEFIFYQNIDFIRANKILIILRISCRKNILFEERK